MLGRIIDGYRIMDRIGAGGMGVVYAAQHERLPKRAAIKVLSTGLAEDSAQVERFFNEARAISLIQHSGIVTLYNYGQLEDGTVYILMELLSGHSLKTLCEQAPLPAAQVLALGVQIARALAEVHKLGIVHRDLKPANVMIISSEESESRQRVKILDFGVAKFVQSLDSRSVPGSVLGTPRYMAPEQYEDSASVGAPADVYALGIILFELLSGQYPYALKGSGPHELMRAHLEQPTRALQSLVSGLPPELAASIHSMLDKEPEQRPTMAALAERLQLQLAALPREVAQLVAAQPVAQMATPLDGSYNETRTVLEARAAQQAIPSRKRFYRRGLAALVLLALTLGGALYARRDRASRTARHEASPIAPTGMLYLPGGRIRLGSTLDEINQAFRDCQAENPSCQREEFERELNGPEVEIPGFFLDVYEVTNEKFARWLNNPLGVRVEVDGNRVTMDGVQILNLHEKYSCLRFDANAEPRFSVVEGRGNRPVVQVTAQGAEQYCNSRGFRLPSEAEWELTARGTERRRYPWGNAPPRCEGVVIGRWQKGPQGGHGPCLGEQQVADVGTSFQDVTPLGIFDLGGNAEEWVAAPARFPYQDIPAPEPLERIVRGGSWNDTLSSARGAGRTRWRGDRLAPEIGFRCATGAAR